MLAAVPVVYIIPCGSGHDAPDETYGKVAGQVGRNHRTEGIDQRVHVHFSVEKPDEGNKEKGRPIPRHDELRLFSQSDLLKMFQVAIGVRTDELAPEIFISVDYGGGEQCFRLDGKRVSDNAIIASGCIAAVVFSALLFGFVWGATR